MISVVYLGPLGFFMWYHASFIPIQINFWVKKGLKKGLKKGFQEMSQERILRKVLRSVLTSYSEEPSEINNGWRTCYPVARASISSKKEKSWGGYRIDRTTRELIEFLKIKSPSLDTWYDRGAPLFFLIATPQFGTFSWYYPSLWELKTSPKN